MKKYFVIGNPIKHSLSPLLHNYWIRKKNIEAVYEKKKIDDEDLKNLILELKEKKISGINVTVPFKKKIIPYLEKLSPEASSTQSVNTIFLDKDKATGHNTDIFGFEFGIRKTKFNISNKEILILGAGGVVPSIIFALKKMNVSKIIVSNRTRTKAENLKNLFKDLNVINWGEIPNFDMVINATSIGLKTEDEINLDFSKSGKDKFFYDLIYNPKETKFLKTGKNLGNITENGKMMFIFQASAAFKLWHGVQPEINEEVFKLLD